MHSLCKVASIDSKWRVLAQSGEYWVLLATLARTKIQSIFQQCCIKSFGGTGFCLFGFGRFGQPGQELNSSSILKKYPTAFFFIF